ncbi:hypothetical protein KZZ52_57930 [Dactylosporangium sp. AC04546]|uniref:hypothetical protein n=1 Tax=Dactylosporangium sp. AC04546 TaxID=2862460 RepID=UPI001EDFCD47|nr:hypothetical protein [Dactylosporangium sp. AC04546]WVK83484.1 hypothetical protein KZZ52_57930 [Dactylosporangium sp. AC04546]
MAVSESPWKEPDATAGMSTPVGARQPWPGAMGPPVVGPPPKLSERRTTGPIGPVGPAVPARPPTPAAQYGAWQGALRPPVFVVNQPRPTYREPLPVRSPMVTAGAAVGAAWMLLFGLLAGSARGYIWLTLIAGILAWGASAVLARFGDRGVAVGVAMASGVAVAIAGIVVGYRMAGGDWVLW